MSSLTALDDQLRQIAATYSGTCTYALTDLSGGGHIGLDEDVVMPLGSLIKVPILYSLYQAAQEGKLALEDRTTYRKEHHSRGSGVLIHMTPGAEMTVRDAAALMIVISDNIATNIVIDLIGLDYINEQMRGIGLEQTAIFRRIGDTSAGLDGRKMSVSTASEIARLFELIGRHQAVSEEASEDMLRILRRNDGRGELSRELPWNELNMLDDPRENWVAEKGGSFMSLRAGGALFHGARGAFAMAAFCEGGTGPGAGRKSEGNLLLGRLGRAAWEALAAPS